MADSYVGYSPADRISLAPGAVTVGALATTGTASSSTYLRGDMAWSTNPLGDVSGPGSSTDNALAKFDSTTGKIIQNSTATLTDAGTLTATAFAGPITGAVTGNVTGNIDGTVGATTPSTVVATQVDITAQGDLRLQDTTGGQYVAIQAAGTVATSWTLTLPDDDGTTSQFLQTNGSGVTTWATVTTNTSGAWTSGTSTTGKALVMGF